MHLRDILNGYKEAPTFTFTTQTVPVTAMFLNLLNLMELPLVNEQHRVNATGPITGRGTRVFCHRVICWVRVIDTVCGVGALLDGGPDQCKG